MNEISVPADDAALATLLAQDGISLGPSDVRELVRGVAAAPAAEVAPAGSTRRRPAPWPQLLQRPPGPELSALLDRLVDETAERFRRVATTPDALGRIAQLRAELARRRLDALVVPLADEHYTEFVPLRAQRLQWLTGFTGSAGWAIITADRAAIFVDGRYTLQVRDQVPAAAMSYHHLIEDPPYRWLAANVAKDARVGYDPWIHTETEVEKLGDACRLAGAALVAVADNPIDAVWRDQPPPPLTPALPHEAAYTGEDSVLKRRRVAASLAKDAIDAVVLTTPESTAWLANLRGNDVACTPLALAFSILYRDATLDLFIDPRKVSAKLLAHLGPEIRQRGRADLGPTLDRLGRDRKRVAIDPASTAAWIVDRLKQAGAEIHRGPDPCALPRACKNATELAGTRAAHRRDGAALTRFLAWLAKTAPDGTLDELAAAATLAAFRAETERIQNLSFNTIAGAGPNGAIVHYRSTPATNRRLQVGEFFLLDSGAQYLDGTTDVTRTIAVGAVSPEMRDRFTRVLKGHIALARARFPKGTSGSQLDALARNALWQAGLDYDHGTGHGVGSYLGVHEGPHRISKIANAIALEPGMIVSNEPGYYKTGAYGIRIENLVAVVPCPVKGAEREMFAFETLTRAPIDRTAIDPALLTPEEIAWLDDFHATVRIDLTPLVDTETAAWLAAATRPLAAG
jgi:Xaa-Pro aminopeptidase